MFDGPPQELPHAPCERTADAPANQLDVPDLEQLEARVATPDNEDYLLMIAQHGTAAQLERLVRGYRRVQRAEELEQANQQHIERELCCFYDDDGTLVIRGRLPPEQGALRPARR